MATLYDYRAAAEKMQLDNFERTIADMRRSFAERGSVAPRRLNEREHGQSGWLAFAYFGAPWRDESTGQYRAQNARILLYTTRAEARRADVSDNAPAAWAGA